MAHSQILPEYQLKPHVHIWVTATLDSKTGTHRIGIKTFKLNFERFDVKTFHILYANESSKIRTHKYKTSGTSMERFGNGTHDDIHKLMDKLKNKNTRV